MKRQSYAPITAGFVVAVIACLSSFQFGRIVERRSIDPDSQRRKTDAPSIDAAAGARSPVVTDEQRGTEIASLHNELTSVNWDLVTPIKEFEAGTIDGPTLRQKTANAEVRALRLCTRMHELANQMVDPHVKEVTAGMTMGLLHRHRGVTMIIEGYVSGDEARALAGSKLLEDGRRQVLTYATQIGDPGSVQSQGLKRVLGAYDESGSKKN